MAKEKDKKFESLKECGDSIGSDKPAVQEDVDPISQQLIVSMTATLQAATYGVGKMHSSEMKDLMDAINKVSSVYDRVKFRNR